jgi:alpha-N-arabinofuranosidase
LASAVSFEKQVDDTAATIRYAKAKKRSKKDVFISWDEWNVWYKAGADVDDWSVAPPILEEVYNLEDALVVATWLNVFLRKCDVVRAACLAQIVNIIGPLLTTREGVLKQTIFYPLVAFSQAAKGSSLDLLVKSPMLETKHYGENPLLDASASFDPETGKQSFFLVNTSMTDEMPIEIEWVEGGPAEFSSASQMKGSDPKAGNSWTEPNAITMVPIEVPQIVSENGRSYARFTLPALSFTTLQA